MPSLTPSPPLSASSSRRGLVDTVAQTFAGVKTFLATLVASAGVQTASLFNTNGGSASDVGVKVGVSTLDASVNFSAKLFSLRTGLGGTEVEKVFVRSDGQLTLTNSTGSIGMTPQSTPVIFASGFTKALFGSGASIWYGPGGAGAGAVVHQYVPTFTVSDETAALAQWFQDQNLSFERMRLRASGRLDQRGVDRSATIGADTQNNPIGINTLASGATSVTITNSLVTSATQWIDVTFHADPGGRYWVTRAVGSFTVNVSAAPGANAPFSWEVKGLL